jgi:transketolase
MTARAELPPRVLSPDTACLVASSIKALAMDAVESASSGHPGMPMGTAEMAVALWMGFLVHDPSSPQWPDRDRFVLSAGHGSMLLYSLLHLHGYDLPIDDLRRFRQLGSRTPGHPEVHETPGVEVTTGPLGTGFAAAVGMALAERLLADRFNRPGHAVVDHFTYAIASDGDLMEGVASEAASFAGHQGLGKLVVLYDDNAITIDGATSLSFSEDVPRRFEAYGWHVQSVDGHDVEAVVAAIAAARAEGERPSLVACRTTIARGAPKKAGTSASHGAPLGADEVAATKQALGWPADPFHVPAEVRAAMLEHQRELRSQHEAWTQRFAAYAKAHSELAAELQGLWAGELPPATFDALPKFEVGTSIATRKAGAKVLAALAKAHPTLVGGSADLAESNGVVMEGLGSQGKHTPSGRNVHFGVREHGMAGICNGMALHGGVRPFDATFLIFSDFMRGCLRLSALMRLPVVHVLSHDSIFLGEDGPTHQPIEQCMSLRMIPNLHVVRPADANETVGAWKHAMSRRVGDGPTAILVSRQNLPVLESSRTDVTVGAYVLWEPPGVTSGDLDGILLATGSEVSLAREAALLLHAKGRAVRVVSMPCWELFAAQPTAYQDEVLPPRITRRLSVEAGVTLGWQRWASAQHGIDRFGASAPGGALAEHFGFTPAAVVEHYLALP